MALFFPVIRGVATICLRYGMGLAGMALGMAAQATPLPPAYVCQRTTEPLSIDGRADEAAWKAAMPLQPLRDIEGGEIPDRTRIRLLWDDAYLYVHAEMQEEHVWASKQLHDSIIYLDPDFEVFIDPDGDTHNYIELEVNALGTTWDLFLPSPYRSNGGVVLHDWEMKGLRHAVHIDGTLNDPRDVDQAWSVEMAIPWSCIWSHGELPRRSIAPAPGTTLRMNFSRVGWQVKPDSSSTCGYAKLTDAQGKMLPETNHVWAPTGEINIHMPELWGRVVLSAREVGTWEAAPPAPDEPLRIGLFSAFRAQLAHRKHTGHFASQAADWQPWIRDAGFVTSLPISLVFSSPAGFLLQAKSRYSGSTWLLGHDGRLSVSPPAYHRPLIYLWVHGNQTAKDAAEQASLYRAYAEAGVDTVIIDGDEETIAKQASLARAAGLRVLAWCWVLNRPQDGELMKRPEWFAVSREGKSCHAEANRPYVPYYQFLCPNHPELRAYLRGVVARLSSLPGVDGVQLDYLRMPDVILPRGLWDRYGLVMDRELAPYDFCYCERCLRLFQEQCGRLPAHDPASDAAWREFRLESVAHLARELAGTIRRHGGSVACAVFPTPQIASRLVRQDWSRFPLDLALPMVYHTFYAEPPEWMVTVTAEAAAQTDGRIPLAPGMHLPDTSARELPDILTRQLEAGAVGIGLFSAEELTPDHLSALRCWLDAQFPTNDHTQHEGKK